MTFLGLRFENYNTEDDLLLTRKLLEKRKIQLVNQAKLNLFAANRNFTFEMQTILALVFCGAGRSLK